MSKRQFNRNIMAHERVRQGRAVSQIRDRHEHTLAKQVQRQLDRQMREYNQPADTYVITGMWVDEQVMMTPLEITVRSVRQQADKHSVEVPQVMPRTRKVRVA